MSKPIKSPRTGPLVALSRDDVASFEAAMQASKHPAPRALVDHPGPVDATMRLNQDDDSDYDNVWLEDFTQEKNPWD